MRLKNCLIQTTRKNAWIAFSIFLVGIIVTLQSTIYVKHEEEYHQKQEYAFSCNEIKTKINTRLQAHKQLLQAASILFSSSDTVTRAEWKTFNSDINLASDFPGILALGYACIVPSNLVKQHIALVHREGLVNYSIKPQSTRDTVTSILYIEPFADRNLRAFGFDMFTEATRRRAMTQARDHNIAVLSGKVVLLQETTKDIQAGALMYLPVYRQEMPRNTIQERRAAIKGWVYSPYRMDDLMQGILGRWNNLSTDRIHLQLYDDSISEQSLLFDSQKNDGNKHIDDVNRTIKTEISFNDKKWVVVFTQSTQQTATINSNILFVAIGGTVFTLLLFILSLSLFNIRFRANQMAQQLTSELKIEKEWFQILLNSSAEGIYGIDAKGQCMFTNKACLTMLGYASNEKLLGQNLHPIIHHSSPKGEYIEEDNCKIGIAIKKGIMVHADDECFWRADGTCFSVEYWSHPIYINGKLNGAVVSFFDNSERKKEQEALKESEQNFRTFFETIDDMIFIANEQGHLFFTNSAVPHKLGYTSDELLGMHVLDVHPNNKREEAEQIFGEMFAGKRLSCPLALAKKDGTLVPVETRVWFGKWNGEKCIFGVSKDLSIEQDALQKFNKFFNNNPALMAVSTLPDRVFNEVNETFLQKTGYSRNEVLGKTALDLALFSNNDEINKVSFMLKEEGQISGLELKIKTKENGYLDGLFSGTVIESQGKRYFITVMTDVTKQKQAEDQMRALTNRLTTLIAHLPGGILMETPERKIQQTNVMFCQLFGIPVPPDALVGADCQDASEGVKSLFVDSQGFIPRILQILEGKKIVLNEELEMLDGRVLQRDYVPIFTSKNEIENLWHYRDITERKKTEDVLSKQSSLQTILMNISSKYINIPLSEIEDTILFSLEELGKFVEADRTYIFEYDWENNVCNNTYEWCEEGISPQIEELQEVPNEAIPQWVACHKQGKAMNIPDVLALAYDDSVRQILEPQDIKSLIAIPMMNDCMCIGFVGFDSVKKYHTYTSNEEALLTLFSQMLVNVKQRATLEKNLIEEKYKADIANNAKSEFLANMSHEIRTPMNAILGFSEALYHKLDSIQHQKMIKSILNSGNLLMSLLNDILDLSKIEAGKLEITYYPVDLNNMMQELLLLFKDKAQAKGVELTCYFEPNFPEILMLDEIRIKQVLFNLIGNALKFTKQGYVKIVYSFEFTQDSVGKLFLSVEDTGIGIPKPQQTIIFDAFKQQSGQSNREYGGAGLGLAISKRLVEKMKGSITVTSMVSKGSIFSVVLNDIKTSSTYQRKKELVDDNHLIQFQGASILVVDDVITNIETVESLLSSSGLVIASAENGEIALEVLKHSSPSVILLDMRMPGIDGYEVAKRIKADPSKNHIPIIAFTASVFSADKIENSNDFADFLFKPVRRAELFSILKKYLKYTTTVESASLLPDNKFEIILTDELKANLSQLILILNDKYIPRWNEIKDSLILFKIEAFAKDLNSLATSFHFNLLSDYAKKIQDDVDSFNIETLQKNLGEFPIIIQTLINISNNNAL